MSKRISCDCCELMRINGMLCHETGCQYQGARYSSERGWIQQRKCFECGCTVDADDPCCNAEYEDDAR